MPTVMNVNEAKSNFSGLLSFVHKDRAVVTIMRYGHPIAQIVPCPPKRTLRQDPLLSRIKINCNLFEDESSDWEAMNDRCSSSGHMRVALACERRQGVVGKGAFAD